MELRSETKNKALAVLALFMATASLFPTTQGHKVNRHLVARERIDVQVTDLASYSDSGGGLEIPKKPILGPGNSGSPGGQDGFDCDIISKVNTSGGCNFTAASAKGDDFVFTATIRLDGEDFLVDLAPSSESAAQVCVDCGGMAFKKTDSNAAIIAKIQKAVKTRMAEFEKDRKKAEALKSAQERCVRGSDGKKLSWQDQLDCKLERLDDLQSDIDSMEAGEAGYYAKVNLQQQFQRDIKQRLPDLAFSPLEANRELAARASEVLSTMSGGFSYEGVYAQTLTGLGNDLVNLSQQMAPLNPNDPRRLQLQYQAQWIQQRYLPILGQSEWGNIASQKIMEAANNPLEFLRPKAPTGSYVAYHDPYSIYDKTSNTLGSSLDNYVDQYGYEFVPAPTLGSAVGSTYNGIGAGAPGAPGVRQVAPRTGGAAVRGGTVYYNPGTGNAGQPAYPGSTYPGSAYPSSTYTGYPAGNYNTGYNPTGGYNPYATNPTQYSGYPQYQQYPQYQATAPTSPYGSAYGYNYSPYNANGTGIRRPVRSGY